jgi:acetyl-CoA carboxylase, biotin carboxylase subunit
VRGFPLKKILIANRGEIAVRILRTCRDMGIASVAVYSECDRQALHVRLADEAYAIGPDAASESYLRIDKLIDVARRAGADAVHPGYGFLAEDAAFAEACTRAGLTFIGPSPAAMASMGSKTGAREIAKKAGVPVIPGTDGPHAADQPFDQLAGDATRIGFPLLVKAVAGGGGKGMRIVRSSDELENAVRTARSEAKSSFGDDGVYLERLLDRPRHIEVQLLGDREGSVVAFVERECSIQRRHQKLIEETPAPSVSPPLREALLGAAERIGRDVAYSSAGTIEFLVGRDDQYYFLEMNTRLQVEHPVTEMVTGIDFVRAQIEIAEGRPLSPLMLNGSAAGSARGHAIECRVYAEDPARGFLPSPGRITHLREPSGPGIRNESGATAGWVVPTSYDPLISKVIAWGRDRSAALARMSRALKEYQVRGITTTIGFCHDLIETTAFRAGDFDTTSIERMAGAGALEPSGSAQHDLEEIGAIAAAFYAYRNMSQTPTVKATGQASLWARQGRLENLRG